MLSSLLPTWFVTVEGGTEGKAYFGFPCRVRRVVNSPGLVLQQEPFPGLQNGPAGLAWGVRGAEHTQLLQVPA